MNLGKEAKKRRTYRRKGVRKGKYVRKLEKGGNKSRKGKEKRELVN